MKVVFPNSRLLEFTEGLELRQGEVHKHGDPIIVPEHPWEGIFTYLYGSVVKSKIYRMWYQAHGIYVAYAWSRDGIRWQKPLFKAFAADRPKIGPTVGLEEGGGELCAGPSNAIPVKSNVVMDLHMPSVIHDRGDPIRPYKLFGYSDQGYRVAFSKDGIHFQPAEEKPAIPLLEFRAGNGRKTWFSDVAPVFRDSRTGKYVSHVKTYESDREERIRRCVGYSESDDFVHWTDPVTIWGPGEDEDRLARQKGFQWADFYGLCGFNYGDAYLGLLWLFYIDHEIEQGTHEGEIEVFLASSADGKNWQRFSAAPLIPLNPSGWDAGMITTANLPIFDKDSIRLYYGGSNMSHGAGEAGNPYDEKSHRFNIGLATLRKDGFVYAFALQGRLVTKPLESKKGQIKINADCSDGRLLIDVVNGSGRTSSFEIAGADFLERILRSAVKGNVVLNVSIENAKLYSLEVM